LDEFVKKNIHLRRTEREWWGEDTISKRGLECEKGSSTAISHFFSSTLARDCE
jgi:hypothetical protein